MVDVYRYLRDANKNTHGLTIRRNGSRYEVYHKARILCDFNNLERARYFLDDFDSDSKLRDSFGVEASSLDEWLLDNLDLWFNIPLKTVYSKDYKEDILRLQREITKAGFCKPMREGHVGTFTVQFRKIFTYLKVFKEKVNT